MDVEHYKDTAEAPQRQNVEKMRDAKLVIWDCMLRLLFVCPVPQHALLEKRSRHKAVASKSQETLILT